MIERRLDILNCLDSLDTLETIPGMTSVRDAHGKCSIPVDGNWRIAFRWNDGAIEDVELKS